MDTHERLRQLLNERGWTEYRLSNEYVAVVEHPGAQRLNTRGAEIVQLRRQGCTLTA